MRKRFGTTLAVDDVDLVVQAGTIHALVGENGAGKSTLAHIAFGAIMPDAGSIERAGTVGLVHQHFELVERLRVWENVLLGREPRAGWRIDTQRARARVRDIAARHGLDVDPDAIVETLPVGIKQRVELLRELEREPAVLLLDEPTATLAPAEIDAFFATIVALARGGTAVLVVTHKLAEVIAYASVVSVMRGGKIVATMPTSQTSVESLAAQMVGGTIPALAERAQTSPSPMLRLRQVEAQTGSETLRSIDLDVRSGEILGVAGVEGNGQSALADALAGMIAHTGTMTLGERKLDANVSPRARFELGMQAIPQDRQREALILQWTVAENAMLGRHRALSRAGRIDRAAVAAFAQTIIDRFDVRPPNPSATIDALSGGNQQKVVVGRALAGTPRFVLAYQPTRGIDVGAAALVQSRLIEARNAGAAILLISFELDEVLALADRIIVLYRGAAVGTFERSAIDRSRLGALMAGAA